MQYCDDCASKKHLSISVHAKIVKCDYCESNKLCTIRKGKFEFKSTGDDAIDEIAKEQMKGKSDFAKENIQEFMDDLSKKLKE